MIARVAGAIAEHMCPARAVARMRPRRPFVIFLYVRGRGRCRNNPAADGRVDGEAHGGRRTVSIEATAYSGDWRSCGWEWGLALAAPAVPAPVRGVRPSERSRGRWCRGVGGEGGGQARAGARRGDARRVGGVRGGGAGFCAAAEEAAMAPEGCEGVGWGRHGEDDHRRVRRCAAGATQFPSGGTGARPHRRVQVPRGDGDGYAARGGQAGDLAPRRVSRPGGVPREAGHRRWGAADGHRRGHRPIPHGTRCTCPGTGGGWSRTGAWT